MHSVISYRAGIPHLTLALLLATCAPCASAAAADDYVLDQAALTNLKMHAEQADPRVQCYLYVQLVHHMTELAGHQLEQGDTTNAAATLAEVSTYADRVHEHLGDSSKRVKDSEMLMHRTTQRLSGFIQRASAEDRPMLEGALKRLNQVQSELLTAVFKH